MRVLLIGSPFQWMRGTLNTGTVQFRRLRQQQLHVTPAAGAKAPVFPHVNARQLRQPAAQKRQKLLRRDAGELRGERLLDDDIHPQPEQDAELHLRAHEHAGAPARD